MPRVIVVVLCLCLAACVSSKKPEVLNPVAASAPGARAIDVHVATTRVPEPNGYFSDRRGQHLSFQYVKISIPPDHTPGQIEWQTGEFGDPGKNFVTLDNRVLAEQQFLRNLEARLPASGEVMVFVHGYNTNHEEAIFRLAQMAADGDTKIAAIAFTWPSRGVVKDYVTDRESSTAARGHLIDFLTMLSRSPKIKAINLFAHSMGAMLTTDALMLAKLRGNGEFGGKLDTVVLASPDIDVDVFLAQFDIIGRRPRQTVILISRDDRALKVSSRIAGDVVRVGAASPTDPASVAAIRKYGFTVIDLTALQTSDRSNHTKFAASPLFLRRMAATLHLGLAHNGATVGSLIVDTAGAILNAPAEIIRQVTR